MKKLIFTLLAASCLVFAKPTVTTTILPTKYFVEQIAGDTLQVNTMVGKGADPHTYEPKPKQMKELEKSELYFAIGIEFEDAWLDRFSKTFKNLRIVKTQEGIEKIAMSEEHEHEEHHEHKHEGEHKHEHHDHEGEHHHHHHDGLDPHIWLDPILVKTQADNIAKALIEKFPQNAKLYEENLAKFKASLDELDSFIKNELKDVKTREFIVYHPSWGYFAKRYDLEQIAIEVEGKEPKPAELKELIEEAKEHGVKVIFVAPQFPTKAANLIAKETGSKVVMIDQLPENWLAEMKKTAEIFAKSL